MNRATGIGLIVALLAFPTVRAHEPVTISEAKKDDSGLLVHEVRSPYQAKTTQIRGLRPDKLGRDDGERDDGATHCSKATRIAPTPASTTLYNRAPGPQISLSWGRSAECMGVH